MLVSLLFLVTFFLTHPLNASPFQLNSNVVCREESSTKIRNIDCHRVLEHIRLTAWFPENITWGVEQSWPGDIPRSYYTNSCALKLLATQPGHKETEVFALSDSWSDLTLVYDICLGYRRSAGGKVVIGKQTKFYAYLGDPEYDSSEGNGSSFGITDSR